MFINQNHFIELHFINTSFDRKKHTQTQYEKKRKQMLTHKQCVRNIVLCLNYFYSIFYL